MFTRRVARRLGGRGRKPRRRLPGDRDDRLVDAVLGVRRALRAAGKPDTWAAISDVLIRLGWPHRRRKSGRIDGPASAEALRLAYHAATRSIQARIDDPEFWEVAEDFVDDVEGLGWAAALQHIRGAGNNIDALKRRYENALAACQRRYFPESYGPPPERGDVSDWLLTGTGYPMRLRLSTCPPEAPAPKPTPGLRLLVSALGRSRRVAKKSR